MELLKENKFLGIELGSSMFETLNHFLDKGATVFGMVEIKSTILVEFVKLPNFDERLERLGVLFYEDCFCAGVAIFRDKTGMTDIDLVKILRVELESNFGTPLEDNDKETTWRIHNPNSLYIISLDLYVRDESGVAIRCTLDPTVMDCPNSLIDQIYQSRLN